MDKKTVSNALGELIKDLMTELDFLHEREKPDKSIECKTERGTPRFYIYDKKKKSKSYLNAGDEKTLRTYCQERYCRKLEQQLPGQITRLEKIEKTLGNVRDEQALFEELPEPVRRYAVPRLNRKQELIEGFYTEGRFADHNPYPKGEQYETDNGDFVRSKSELIIANMLHGMGIHYDYERVVYLKNGSRKYPDFTILNLKTGKKIIWEHFGRLDDEKYLNENLKKIEEYHRYGYIQGRNLIMTFESKERPLSTLHIRALIEQFLK